MWSFLTAGLSGLVSGVMAPLCSLLAKKQDDTLDGFKAAGAVDAQTYQAWLAYRAQVDTAHMAETSWWGPKLCLMLVAIPACIHVALVFLDSSFTFGSGHYGSLGIAKLPADYFIFEQRVIEWLFGAAVAGPAVSAVSAWLHRR